MIFNPAGLPRIRRKQRQPHEPMFARLPEVSRGLELSRFGRQLIQLFGMHQRLALIAHQRSGREFVRAAFAVANKFGSDCGRHGFEERSLILTEGQLRGLGGVVEGAEDFKRPSRSEFGGDLHAHEEDHHADKPAERNPAA